MMKTVGLCLAAILMVGVLSAPTASATNGVLTAEAYPATLEGTEIAGEVNALTAFGEKVECPGSTYSGKTTGATSELSLSPSYNNSTCKAIGGGGTHKATTTMNGCLYVNHIRETTGLIIDQYYNTIDIVCPAGKDIEIHVYFAENNENLQVCKLTLTPQLGLTGLKVTTITAIHHFKFESRATNMIVHKSGLCGSATTESAELDMNVEVRGQTEAGSADGLEISHS